MGFLKVSRRTNNNSSAGTAFDIANFVFLGLYALIALTPFLLILGGSFADDIEFKTKGFFIIPEHVTLKSYRFIFRNDTLMRGIFNSVFITITGTLINLFFTFTMAYPLSRKSLMGRRFLMNAIVFSMLFSGGMIPGFLLVKGLGMLNTYWALILPGAISAGNLIVVRSFFQDLPPSLEEAAQIDGCSDLQVLWRIVLPLSMPILATFGLFYAVGHWNNFFSAMIYLNDTRKFPLQVLLRQIVMLSQGTLGDIANMDPNFRPPEEGMKMAVIVVGTIPILMVYPFLQKHFAKGVMIGAVKG